ncbi:hypothetical protein DRQ07_04010 [candidate division KSB1 bacterium]|nr:MAG: hypothetical protein DRQ07_04010 [candidate division KSB1 bacterium]
MPRKKGLGKVVEKSLEEMSQLIKALEVFGTKTCREKLKKNIASSSLERNEKDIILKLISEISGESLSLSNKIDDLRDRINDYKPQRSSRFAKNVVSRFLNSD